MLYWILNTFKSMPSPKTTPKAEETGRRILDSALTLFREHVPKKDTLAAQAADWLGAIQVARKAYPEAEALMLSGSDQFFAAAEMTPNERRVAVGTSSSSTRPGTNPKRRPLGSGGSLNSHRRPETGEQYQ